MKKPVSLVAYLVALALPGDDLGHLSSVDYRACYREVQIHVRSETDGYLD